MKFDLRQFAPYQVLVPEGASIAHVRLIEVVDLSSFEALEAYASYLTPEQRLFCPFSARHCSRWATFIEVTFVQPGPAPYKALVSRGASAFLLERFGRSQDLKKVNRKVYAAYHHTLDSSIKRLATIITQKISSLRASFSSGSEELLRRAGEGYASSHFATIEARRLLQEAKAYLEGLPEPFDAYEAKKLLSSGHSEHPSTVYAWLKRQKAKLESLEFRIAAYVEKEANEVWARVSADQPEPTKEDAEIPF